MVRTRIAMLLAGVVGLSFAAVVPASAVDYSISASISSTEINLGQKVKIEVQISPSNPGGIVELQERISGNWTHLASKALDSSSEAVFRPEPGTRGKHYYRVRRPATFGSKEVLAGPFQVLVHQWMYLDRLNPTGPAEVEKAVNLDGKNFRRSVVYPQCQEQRPSAVTWTYDLDGKFEEFRATLGVPAGADPTKQKQITLILDGTTFHSAPYHVGVREVKSFNVEDGNTLQVKIFGPCGSPKAYGALGNPQVLR